MNDLISRQAAIEAINAYLVLSEASRTIQDMTSVQDILKRLPSAQPMRKRRLPSAQPMRKRGRWMADNRSDGGFWVCSNCKFPSKAFAADVLYKFCPSCGADMRGEQNE